MIRSCALYCLLLLAVSLLVSVDTTTENVLPSGVLLSIYIYTHPHTQPPLFFTHTTFVCSQEHVFKRLSEELLLGVFSSTIRKEVSMHSFGIWEQLPTDQCIRWNYLIFCVLYKRPSPRVLLSFFSWVHMSNKVAPECSLWSSHVSWRPRLSRSYIHPSISSILSVFAQIQALLVCEGDPHGKVSWQLV